MAEWLYEEGLGENRAALVTDGAIVEAQVELPDTIRAGAVVEARLTSVLVAGRRGIVSFAGGEALIEPLPAGVTEGGRLRVELVREPIAEPGRPKLARAHATDKEERPAPALIERIRAGDAAVTLLRPHQPDRLEQAGWSELLEEAATGEIGFAGGALRMSLTPAMTLFDVDGALAPAALAEAGARAAGTAIRRLSVTGSIGIDLPTLPDRAARQAAAAALDAVLPPPFERTAVNGFGFLQLVRRRERASLPELVQFDAAGAAARALLRRAERTHGAGTLLVTAAPAVIERIRPEWVEALARGRGAAVALRPDPALAISAGHVHASS